MSRFNIVVLNYNRLSSFVDNVDRIKNLSPQLDRITILTASPSEHERMLAEKLKHKTGVGVEYISRQNKGIDQFARVEYFSGQLEPLTDLLQYEYIFQFQEHYLDLDSSFSKWGPDENFRIKGDVIPNNTVLDLDLLHQKFAEYKIAAAFCDRHNPSWFRIGNRNFIAPSGGNFFVKTSRLQQPEVQQAIISLGKKCDNTYQWAVYAEYKWGEIFFPEGYHYYDIKRDRIFSSFLKEDFYVDINNIQIPDKWFDHKLYHFVYPVYRYLKKAKKFIGKKTWQKLKRIGSAVLA